MLVSPATGSLPYCLESGSPVAHYMVGFLCTVLGLVPEFLTREGAAVRPHLYYGDQPLPTSRVVIPLRTSNLVWAQILEAGERDPDLKPRLSFDVIDAMRMLLTDEVNARQPATAFGRDDRLLFARSFQAQHGIAHLPVVNGYVRMLAQLIKRELHAATVPLWPDAKQATIGLSHDVDRPDKYGILRAVRERRRPRLAVWPRFYAKALYHATQRLRDPHPDDFWLFDHIMAAESKLGFRSTFFFASMPSFGAWGAFEDVNYDISWPRFGPLFRSMVAGGFEIGLHASYNAHQASGRLAAERQRLEDVAGVPARGLRHHYWHLGPNVNRTLRFHEECGFLYDSSLAFNEHMGFRRNVALPFHPWDPDRSLPVRTLQLPTFCMDGNLFYGRMDVGSAVREVKRYVDTIKRLGGLGVIDWHVRTSYPGNTKFRDWGRAYLEILELLAAEHDLWVTNLGEIATWVTQREEVLFSQNSAG